MAVGEHYSLKLFGNLLGQQFLNTFAYRQTSGVQPNEAALLALQFGLDIQFHLAACVGDYCAYTRIEAFSIETPTDYSDDVAPVPFGARIFAVDGQPPAYVAFGFRSNRAGAGSRSSYKRFCGIGDTDMIGNELEASFLALAPLAFLQTNLGDPLAHGSGVTFVPIQLESGWIPGGLPIENFTITSYGDAYLTSQVSRRK